jgi:hypothetical protein
MERPAQECSMPVASHRSRSSGKAFAVTSMIGVRRARVLSFAGTDLSGGVHAVFIRHGRP